MHPRPPTAVVVGIDGSESAIRAAEWAVGEAASRCLPLRLIHVIEPGSEAVRLENEYAEAALATARAAVDATGTHVPSEAVVRRGGITTVLTEESRHAAMMCVGSSGVDYPLGKLLGSVAGAMALAAHCPTAVIRAPTVESRDTRRIAVIVGDPNTADALLRVAMDEARLRSASLVILRVWPITPGSALDDHVDRRIILWGRRYPDVEVHPAAAVYTSPTEFFTDGDHSVLLAIVDTAGSGEAARFRGPSVVSKAPCSLIVVNPAHSRRPLKQRRPVNSSVRRLQTSPSTAMNQFLSVSP